MIALVRPRLGHLADVDVDQAAVPNAGTSPGPRVRTISNGVAPARSEFATGLLDGRLYRIGGWHGAEFATCHWYDIAADTWDTGASMPAARRSLHHQDTADGTYVYAAGGQLGSAVTTLYRYDPNGDTWDTMAALPAARQMGACIHVDGSLWYLGGSDGSPGSFCDTLWRYDIAGDTWHTAHEFMSITRRDAPAVHHNGTIYVFGGETTAGVRTAVCEAYSIADDTWTTLEPLPEARRGASAFYCLGTIIVTGGNTTTSISDETILVYDPTANTWTAPPVSVHSGYWRGGATTSADGVHGWVQAGRLGTSGTNNSQRLMAVHYDDPLDFHAAGGEHGTWIGDGP